MSIFKRKSEKSTADDGIIILKSTAPGMCGGTDATLDTKAPKKILSDDMVLFDATSALPSASVPSRAGHLPNPLAYLSAFAVPASGGTFLFLETSAHPHRREGKKHAWALVKENVFPALAHFVRAYDFAKNNGSHSKTHGLPENFGGSVDIRYASGEAIGFSDNQSPIMTPEEGSAIYNLFTQAIRGEQIPLPDMHQLQKIRFIESRKDGGYTKAVLTLHTTGAVNQKTQKFDDSNIFESEHAVDAQTVAAIRKTITDCGMFAWGRLPEKEFKYGKDKTLTFVFADGKEITITDNKRLPCQIDRGFFKIELELTVKH